MICKLRLLVLALSGIAISTALAFKSEDKLTASGGLTAPAVLVQKAREIQADQMAAVDAAAKADVAVVWHDVLATPISVRGKDLSVLGAAIGLTKGMLPARQGNFAVDALTVLDNVAGLFRIRDVGQEFIPVRDDKDGLGHHHVRLEQNSGGLRVVGGELIVHFDAMSRPYEVNGRYVADIAVDIAPHITAEMAERVARQDQSKRGLPSGTLFAAPELVVYAWDSDPRLAWELTLLYLDQKAGSGRWRYWIDARDRSIIRTYNDIQRIAAPTANGVNANITGTFLDSEGGGNIDIVGWRENTGIYYLYDKVHFWYVYNVASSGYSDNNTYAYRNIALWFTTDRAEMSLAKNFTWAQKYFKNVHGRNSYNNANAYARANVHAGIDYVNAWWDGSDFHFADGDNVEATALCTTDIAGHEFTHAVTKYSAELYYYGESGALNESFSDIFGTCIEFYSQPDGRVLYPNKQAGYADWLLGEDAWLSAKALRDMRNPANTITVGLGNQQPTRYKGTYWYFGTGDKAGVHQNSGVQNFFFYLLCEGGVGNNDGIDYNVTGIGRANAEKVAYRALTSYCGVNTDHIAARSCWVSAAEDLNSAWVSSVESAWGAVGVGASQQSVATPVITPAGDAYGSAVTAQVTCATAGAAIRYTTDSSEPTESSALYVGPIIIIGGDTTLKAKGFKSGMIASVTASATYSFLGTRVFNFPLTTDPGWTTSGQWAFGVPTGGGGQFGYPDPTAGFTGATVYGYNLDGDYAHDIASTHWLTTPALDLSYLSNTRLVFRRWLGVERPAYDHAYIEVSNDGSTWTRVWQNDTQVADSAWVRQALDISSVADLRSTVYIRWGLGPTDSSWAYCGWNIDDIEIWAKPGFPTAQPPASPTNLSASALSSNIVELRWQDRADNEMGFKIERRAGGTWGQIATVGANDTVCADFTVAGGTSYVYRVRAYNTNGDSDYSNEAFVNIPTGNGDIWDPADDTRVGATELNAPTDFEMSHGLHILSAADYYDWFKVYLAVDTTYNFNSSGGSGDTYAELFDQDGNKLVVDDDSGGNRQFSLTYTPIVGGWHYLSVRSYYLGENAIYNLKYGFTAGNSWTLGDALNAPGRAWHSGNYDQFFGQTLQSHDGMASAQSGDITDGGYSWLGTVVTGPGIGRFWWKVSSEANGDYLRFYRAGDRLTRMWISGESGWQHRSFVVPKGGHMFYWAYSKDNSISAGRDAGWVDQFTFRPRNRSVINDYDNDGKSDLAVFEKTTGKWYIYSLGRGVSLSYGRVSGLSSMTMYPGDYDGDGGADLAVYNSINGAWYIQTITGVSLANGLLWGFAAGTPVPGDYDGDGVTDLAIYHAAAGKWYIRTLSGRTLAWGLNWGYNRCVAVPGDYDGDGKSDLAVYDTSSSKWYIRTLAARVITWNTSWGFTGAIPVPGDYNGDACAELAVFDPDNQTWYIKALSGEILADGFSWGLAGSTPLAGDFDGDGADDLAIYSAGKWYVCSLIAKRSLMNAQPWGTQNSIPIRPKY